MKTLQHWALAAGLALGSLALTGSNANALLLDGFGDSQAAAFSETNGTTGTSADNSKAVTDTGLNTPVTRDLSATALTGASVGNPPGTGNGVVLNVTGGLLNHSQSTGVTGTSLTEWNFDSTPFGGTSIRVYVTFADLGGSITFTLKDDSNNMTSVTKAIPAGKNFSKSFALSGFAPPVDLTDVVYASLLIDGSSTTALNISVDFIAVAEPATLGVLGLGLLGLGFAARRRKAA